MTSKKLLASERIINRSDCFLEVVNKGIIVERDVPVEMRDGLKLAANVFRPDKPGKFPVIMGITAFGKDSPWSPIFPGWGIAYEPYSPTVTGSTAFEAPDPNFWVPYEYVVIILDSRGKGRSPGQELEHDRGYQDYYDAIEWAGTQEWSNGNVGMTGVSTFGMAQWAVASLNPPHLKAIDPWEAFTSTPTVSAGGIFGGIPETGFLKQVSLARPPHHPVFPEPVKEEEPPPVRGSYEYLEDITVPTLVCATWSDHMTHTRGTSGGVFLAYQKISSEYKWLYTHGRQKWAEFYSSEAKAFQKQFFDCFLKGTDSRIMETPRVRLEVRDTLDRYTVRYENEWPIGRTEYMELYLDANTGTLNFDKAGKEGRVSYDSESADGRASFDITFDQDTELTGPMNLKLWVSPENADDADLFVTLRKIDTNGDEVLFDCCHFPVRYPVAFGGLRLSNRELDEEKSTPGQPWHTFRVEQKVEPGEIVPCQIEIYNSSTLFHKGETLRLVISGKFQVESTWYEFDDLNEGKHTIYIGGEYDSYLLVPVIPATP